MERLSALGYIVFEVSDIAAWQFFSEDLLGGTVGRVADNRSFTIRLDDYENRLTFRRGNANDLVAAGWELPSKSALEKYSEQLRAAGVDLRDCPDDLAADRQVSALYACSDPSGWQHEFYHGPRIASGGASINCAKVRNGFVAGRLGAGHILAFADDLETANNFYRDTLGLYVSDRILATNADGHQLDATFYHTATGRHHSLATAQNPGIPKRLGHFMVEMRSMYDVGMALDRFVESGVTVVRDIGQHPNDQMTSFYVETPSGFYMEVGTGGIVIDESKWTIGLYSETSLWGHRRPARAT